MKEFMLFIRPEGDNFDNMSAEDQQKHIEKFGDYIGRLIKQGILKSAQPLEAGGRIVSGKNGVIMDGPFIETKEVIGGYFHIVAKNMDEAVEVAKANPLFQREGGIIEVREIKLMEGINA
jgi:hypothetical protein